MKIVTGTKTAVLRSSAKPVDNVDDEIRALIRTMQSAMKEAEGIGLAAPQIGVPLRIFVAEVKGKFYAVINPEIIKTSKKTDIMEEGCLSVPGYYGPVKRFRRIVISGLDQRGKKIKIKAFGLLARVFQHEIDHLNGTLFVDKAKELRKVEHDAD